MAQDEIVLKIIILKEMINIFCLVHERGKKDPFYLYLKVKETQNYKEKEK